MATVVRTDGLTKDFTTGFWRPRPARALDGVSLDVPQGGVFGLLGPNGAGKSTTLKLLLNLLRPTKGRIEVLGAAPGSLEARRRLGFLAENPVFYDYLSAEELLTYFAGLCGFGGAESRARAGRMLDMVGLADERRRPMRQYSKGMVQRVGIAQALVHDPELVILDEPMSGLDPLGRRDVRDLILRLRDDGRTVLFSSHILSDAELLCSRVAILAKGKLVAAGPLADLTAGGARGWEVLATGVPDPFVAAVAHRGVKAVSISDGRYSFELPPDASPEAFIAELSAAGSALISVTPLRVTLEDVFLEHVR